MSSLVQAIAVCRSYAVETRTLDVLRGGGPGDYFTISEAHKFVMMRPR